MTQIAVVIINHMQANPVLLLRNLKKDVAAHVCMLRVFLSESKRDVSMAKIVDSPYLNG